MEISGRIRIAGTVGRLSSQYGVKASAPRRIGRAAVFSYWAGIRVTKKRDKVIFNPLTQEAFELRNVPSGGRELTFFQEKRNAPRGRF